MTYWAYTLLVRMFWGIALFIIAFVMQCPRGGYIGKYRRIFWPDNEDLPRVLIISVILAIVGFCLGPLIHRWRNDRLEDD
jgi:hypothetical protein